LPQAKRLCSRIHLCDESGLTATHCLGQHHSRIIAGSGYHCEDGVPHGNPISGSKTETGASLPGGMDGDPEFLVKLKRTILDRCEGEVEGQ